MKARSGLTGGILIICVMFLFVEGTYSQGIGQTERGATRMGITGLMGAGLFVAADKDYYGGISTDLYPEIGLQIDVSMLRLGIRAGYIYRKVEFFTWIWYPSSSWEYTLAYVPLQAEILLAPMSGQIVTPYVGVAPGVFIPAGDNDDALFTASIKLGLEASLEPLIMYGDIRYTYARHDTGLESADAGGVMLIVGGGVRLGNW